jgi:hypothetical protein
MVGACLACILVVRSSSADDAVDLVRHQGRTLATAVLATSADKNASVLVWARLSTGFPRRDWAVLHSFVGALGHARDGAVGIAHSRSWWRCLMCEIQ